MNQGTTNLILGAIGKAVEALDDIRKTLNRIDTRLKALEQAQASTQEAKK